MNQQGNDRGTSYRSAIFYQNETERTEAEAFINVVNESERWEDPVVTTLEPFTHFWPAEEYHQEYIKNNPDNPYVKNVSIPRYNNFKKKYAVTLYYQV